MKAFIICVLCVSGGVCRSSCVQEDAGHRPLENRLPTDRDPKDRQEPHSLSLFLSPGIGNQMREQGLRTCRWLAKVFISVFFFSTAHNPDSSMNWNTTRSGFNLHTEGPQAITLRCLSSRHPHFTR